MNWIIAVTAGWHVLTHKLLALASGGIAASTLDDLIVDLIYFRFVMLRRTRMAVVATANQQVGWMAIIIPAWDESDVIAAMLTDLTRRTDYPSYLVFVGVYPNDPQTRSAVASVNDSRIRTVECERPGPTTKADCLNHLWRAVIAHELSGIM